MRNLHFYVLTTCLTALLSCGCDALSGPRRDPSKAPPPQDATAASESEGPSDASTPPASGDEKPQALTAGGLKGPGANEAASRGVSEEEAPIQLSAGVALPQSFPTGTVMSFSVDYRFASGGPDPSCRYVWIIRASGAADPWEAPVQLQSQGTLQSFVEAWRPEQGPFEAALDEVDAGGKRRRISSTAPLKASDW
jgi:hypothetical protein